MGISIFSNGDITAYNVKHYIIDTIDDINKLSTNIHPGSTAFIVETSEYYMLNNKQNWQKVQLNNNNSSGSTITDDTELILEGGSPI